MRGLSVRLRRGFHGLRTEGAGTLRETAAVALGVFIGCLPVYGFHLLICWGVGFAFGLNRLKMYLAANISNPLVAPWLLFAEVQAGAWLQRGAFHPLTLHFSPLRDNAFLLQNNMLMAGFLRRLDADIVRAEVEAQIITFCDAFGR